MMPACSSTRRTVDRDRNRPSRSANNSLRCVWFAPSYGPAARATTHSRTAPLTACGGRHLSTLHPIQDHDPLLLFPVQRDCLHGDISAEQLRGVTITDLSQPKTGHIDSPRGIRYSALQCLRVPGRSIFTAIHTRTVPGGMSNDAQPSANEDEPRTLPTGGFFVT